MKLQKVYNGIPMIHTDLTLTNHLLAKTASLKKMHLCVYGTEAMQ